MVWWMGRGMTALMVVQRKPTPVGLELHALCDAFQSGLLTWFEVYEGKEVVANKEYNDQYPKSIALTLRMCKPYFSTACFSAQCVSVRVGTGANRRFVVQIRGVRARPVPPRPVCGDERKDGANGLPEDGAARQGRGDEGPHCGGKGGAAGAARQENNIRAAAYGRHA
eukprot:3881682-Pleurochrysis_carterae.AAC.1